MVIFVKHEIIVIARYLSAQSMFGQMAFEINRGTDLRASWLIRVFLDLTTFWMFPLTGKYMEYTAQ